MTPDEISRLFARAAINQAHKHYCESLGRESDLTLQLSEREITMILTALQTVTPMGGGSDEMNLSGKIAFQSGLDSNDWLLQIYNSTVLEIAEDCGVITINEETEQ